VAEDQAFIELLAFIGSFTVVESILSTQLKVVSQRYAAVL
jgi:hypothetical protein